MRIPKYRLHRKSGQALIEWRGHRYYLGRYNSPDSREKYKRFLEEKILPLLPVTEQAAPIAARGLTVNELAVVFLRWARGYYGKGEFGNLRYVAGLLADFCGDTEVANFGPVKLKEFRKMLEDRGLSRSYINGQVNRARRFFRYAVEHELAPPGLFEGLRAVPGLRAGRTKAREPEPIEPVADDEVEALLPHLCPVVRAMVQVQRLTGMRSDELCRLRGDRINRQVSPWLYRVGEHKTKHRGIVRVVPIGPRAQAILALFLERPANQYLFSPAEVVDAHHKQRRELRKTKLQPSQANRKRRAKPIRKPGERYQTRSYYRSILAGFVRMAKANKHEPPVGKFKIHAWLRSVGIEPWHPHRLRHSFATAVRSRFGLEGAQVSLGHSKADVTQIYAERDLGLAIGIAAEIG